MLEYQIPLWIALISLIFGCLIGMFAMGVVAIGKNADLELEIFTLQDKNKEIETKLKESLGD